MVLTKKAVPIHYGDTYKIDSRYPEINQKWAVECNSCYCNFAVTQKLQDKETLTITDKELQKFKKEKWSNTKINHWIENKKKILERNVRSVELHHDDFWYKNFQQIFRFQIKKISILLHWSENGLQRHPCIDLTFAARSFATCKEKDLIKFTENEVFTLSK